MTCTASRESYWGLSQGSLSSAPRSSPASPCSGSPRQLASTYISGWDWSRSLCRESSAASPGHHRTSGRPCPVRPDHWSCWWRRTISVDWDCSYCSSFHCRTDSTGVETRSSGSSWYHRIFVRSSWLAASVVSAGWLGWQELVELLELDLVASSVLILETLARLIQFVLVLILLASQLLD